MYCFFVFTAVVIAVATASYFDLKGHSVMSCGKIQNVFVYKSETTVYYKNVPVLLRGTFYTYSVSAMKLSWLSEHMKNYEYFVIWNFAVRLILF